LKGITNAGKAIRTLIAWLKSEEETRRKDNTNAPVDNLTVCVISAARLTLDTDHLSNVFKSSTSAGVKLYIMCSTQGKISSEMLASEILGASALAIELSGRIAPFPHGTYKERGICIAMHVRMSHECIVIFLEVDLLARTWGLHYSFAQHGNV
jgi:hypothetical protein